MIGLSVDDASVAEGAAGVGFDSSFSRNCEQIFQAARMGAFLTMAEFRQNLRIAGMVLGPDEIETPAFEFPDVGSFDGDDDDEFVAVGEGEDVELSEEDDS